MKIRNAFAGKRFTHRLIFYLWDRANAIAQVFTAIGRFFFSAPVSVLNHCASTRTSQFLGSVAIFFGSVFELFLEVIILRKL